MTAYDRAKALLDEAEAYPAGSLDAEYRRRAAWKLYQISLGIPACNWTAEPPAKQEAA